MTIEVPFLIHRERHTKVERVESHSLMVLSSCIHHCSDLVQGRHDTVNSTIHGKITEIIVRVATSPEMVTIDRGVWAVVPAPSTRMAQIRQEPACNDSNRIYFWSHRVKNRWKRLQFQKIWMRPVSVLFCCFCWIVLDSETAQANINSCTCIWLLTHYSIFREEGGRREFTSFAITKSTA